MKWKSLLISFITLFMQMAVLFIVFWYKWFPIEQYPLFLAVSIILIGIIGGVLVWHQNKKNNKENKSFETTILLLGSIIGTVGVYLVFIPAMVIFMHSGIATFLFISGILAPSLVPRLLSMRGSSKNA